MLSRVAIALLTIGAGWNATAQTGSWDTSGNHLLNGTYYFRQVIWSDNAGDIGDAISAYGTISFNPAVGAYTINGTTIKTANGSSTSSTFSGVTGLYSISASGYGFIGNGLSTGDRVYGLVGKNGVFIGSTTEGQSAFNDLFIAAPIGSTPATAATFTGNYAIMDLDDPGAGLPQAWKSVQNVLMTVSAKGDGSLGTIALNGYVGGRGDVAVSQSISGADYTFSDGAGNIRLPSATTNLMSGSYLLYISPDGNFVFGGSPSGWDMFVGVRTGAGIPDFNGLYYQAGMDVSLGYISEYGSIDLDGYYGSFRAGNGQILGHQRFADQVNGPAYDYNYGDVYTFNSDGSTDSSYLGQHYIFSADGSIRIGLGNVGSPVLGLNVAQKAPAFNGTGFILDPTGIANAASSAPFTTRIAPGQLLTLYTARGSTLATGAVQDATFPTILAGVQVNINGILAPILQVNECGPRPCVTVMVPYEIRGEYVAIQVTSGGQVSNTIVGFAGSSAPGVFTIPAGGVGYAAAQHTSDFSTVTKSNPAQMGETIVVYVTGLGAMRPPVADGAPGPSNPLDTAVESVWAFVGGVQADVTFAGLTPGVIGLAQVNLVIPSGVTPGDNNLDIATCPVDCATNGFDSYTSEALISVSGSNAGSQTSSAFPWAPKAQRARRPMRVNWDAFLQ